VYSDNTYDHVCEEPGECRLHRHPRYRWQAPPVLSVACLARVAIAGLPSSRRTSAFVVRRI
jgi:hypothetical protein